MNLDLEGILKIFVEKGSMTVQDLSTITEIPYHTVRRHVQILLEQKKLMEVPRTIDDPRTMRNKKYYRAVNGAQDLDYPQAVWPDKQYMSVSRFPLMIIEQNNAEVEFASGKQYKQISKWITLILNEAIQQMRGEEPNLKAVISYRNSIEDTIDKIKEMIRVIELLIDQPVLKPGETFGLFGQDPTFKSEMGYVMQAVNIIMDEVVYPEVLPKETNDMEV